MGNLLDSFVLFSENVPFYGYMVINGDDKNIKKISKKIFRAQITFGESKKCDYRITSIKAYKGKQKFEIVDKKINKTHKFKINLPGKHNVFNALMPIFLIFASSVNSPIMLGARKYTIVEAIATIANAREIA